MGRVALYSLMTFLLTLPLYLIGSGIWLLITLNFFSVDRVSVLPRLLFFLNLLVITSFTLLLLDLVVLPRILKKGPKGIRYNPIVDPKISVVMTCYNDEEATPLAVRDFMSQEGVIEVVAVDNNSTDNTAKVAREAGARVVNEDRQGYGYTCMRALREGKGDIIVLVESDRTFRAYDMKKMIPYLENADLVLGTRTTQEFLDQNSQLDWFLNWGNIFLAKLIQVRFSSEVRLTDVGCTYRGIRREALYRIIDQLHRGGNDLSPEMVMVALKNKLKVIEIPVTFSERVGESKVAGKSRWIAFKLGLQMIWLILRFR